MRPAPLPGSFEPLSLEYVGAGVAGDHDVRLVDLRIEPDFDAAVADFAPDLVGVTAYTVHVTQALALCRRVKELRPEALTVIGGHHATVRPADFARPGVDLVVAGEGVATFREIARRHEQRRGCDGLPGVFAVRGAELAGDPALPTTDLARRRLGPCSRRDFFRRDWRTAAPVWRSATVRRLAAVGHARRDSWVLGPVRQVLGWLDGHSRT
jgi:radical SAM superfamily enzyme YgiQ (UPF0313 family)